MFVLLLAISMANVIWALGRSWPIRDPALLARTVVGSPGATHVPRRRALGLAFLTFGCGVLALALADETSGAWALNVVGVAAALLFGARGILGYTQRWRERSPEEPYRSLNRRNYSPLALLLGLGYLALVVLRLT